MMSSPLKETLVSAGMALPSDRRSWLKSLMVVGRHEQLVVLGEDGDGLDEGEFLRWVSPISRPERLAAVLGHAVFTGDGQGSMMLMP